MGEIFDSKASVYDAWYLTKEGRIIDTIEKNAILSLLKPQAGMKILDIGCGTGNYSIHLAKQGVKVTGVDISEAMLERAIQKASQENLDINFIRSDARKLPFKDNYFDSVISVSAYEFVDDLSQALNEAFRVLKNGGRLVIGLINRDSAWGRYYIKKAERKKESVFSKANFYTLEEVKKAMPGKLIETCSVLFIPPEFDFSNQEKAFRLEKAAKESGSKNGGFICACSQK